jgi:hypothetical protein
LRIIRWKPGQIVQLLIDIIGRGGDNMRSQRIYAALGIAMLVAAPLQGQVPLGRWEKVAGLLPGTQILVELKAGERLEGTFKRLGPDAIVISEPDSQERTVARSMVKNIRTAATVRDRLCNGALIGTLAGAAAGVIGMVAFANAKTNGPVYWGDEDGPGYLLGAAMVGGGIGAAAGAAVDAAIKGRELLYEAK